MNMKMKPETLISSHNAGKLLQVDPSSINNWIDEGLIQAHRTPGGHRRISISDLVIFLKKHHMPVPASLSVDRVLLLEPNNRRASAITRALKRQNIEVFTAKDELHAAFIAGKLSLTSMFSELNSILRVSMSIGVPGIKLPSGLSTKQMAASIMENI